MSEKRAVPVIALLLSAVCFAVYAVLAARDIMFGDAVELVVAAATNGVAHPPGYPLWIVLGHWASLVPFGALAYRVNLTACLYHALVVGFVYTSAYVLVRRHAAALFAALLLAIAAPLFVNWSLQAEVFSLNDLFAAAIVLLSLLWLDDVRRWWLLALLALFFGLGLSNQQTIVLLGTLPLWSVWCARRAVPAGKPFTAIILVSAALLLLGFWIPYLHIILTTPHLPRFEFGEAHSFSELVDVIDRHAFGSFNLVAQANEQGGSPIGRVLLMLQTGAWPYLGAALGLMGLANRKRYRPLVMGLLIVAGPLLAFCIVANFSLETEIARGIFARFGLLPVVGLAPFTACSIYLLEAAVQNRRVERAIGVTVAVLALPGAAATLPARSLANVHGVRTLARDIFAALPPHAILLTASAAVEVVPTYFQRLEGWRPDVTELSYAYLSMAPYRYWVSQWVNVPSEAAVPMAPNELRDLLMKANPKRPFLVVGDRPIHAPGPLSQPLVLGIVSQMIPLRAHVDQRRHYRRESALQSRSGYGNINPNFWKSNGFAGEVRPFYAGGFFTAGMDAKNLGNRLAARYWLERAKAYSPDPLIDQELQQLGGN